jgi:hypothetical protein
MRIQTADPNRRSVLGEERLQQEAQAAARRGRTSGVPVAGVGELWPADTLGQRAPVRLALAGDADVGTVRAAVAAPTPAPASITFEIGPGRDESQTGTATLTAQESQTLVEISIQPGPAGVAQPVHIHMGSWPNVGGVEITLTSVVDGTSTTTVDAPLDSLRDGNHAINVHMSGAQAGVYVTCGNIPAP